jgi:prolyl-tRNA editing enzyme YbaK/EbsC (Cys-tRNA(Pro) deacylase)
MKPATAASALKVQAVLGADHVVMEFDASTRTAAEAAAAIGCSVAEIAKSLVFRAKDSGRAVVVIASGVNKVDERRVADLIGEEIGRAEADFVREQTGFAIGGVPPTGHPARLPTLIDADLMQYGAVWAAAGTPHAVFRLTPTELVTLTGGQVACIRLSQGQPPVK